MEQHVKGQFYALAASPLKEVEPKEGWTERFRPIYNGSIVSFQSRGGGPSSPYSGGRDVVIAKPNRQKKRAFVVGVIKDRRYRYGLERQRQYSLYVAQSVEAPPVVVFDQRGPPPALQRSTADGVSYSECTDGRRFFIKVLKLFFFLIDRSVSVLFH